MPSLVPEHDQWAYHPKHKLPEYSFKPAFTEFKIDPEAFTNAITTTRLDRIAEAIRGLTYGQMITMAVELGSLGPITKDTIANVLWEWSVANVEANSGRFTGVEEFGQGGILPPK